MKPGVYPNLTREEYEAIDAVNLSTLRHMKKSPAHYRASLLGKGKDSAAKKLGRAVHIAVFEPERFARSTALWTGKVRNGKVWDAFQQENASKEILTESEYAEAMTIQGAVRGDPVAKEYIEKGHGEVTVVWERHGVLCKGRMDFIGEKGIPDLKTTRDASLEGFGRSVNEYGYHVQAAWYADGYAAATGERKPYFVIAVESDAPHVVQVYRVPDRLMQAGRTEYSAWMEKLIFCRAQNWWPGYADQVVDLALPKWAAPIDEPVAEASGR